MLSPTHTKNNRSTKNGDKDGKALYKLMNMEHEHSVCENTMENLRKRINVKRLSNKKD